MRDTTNSFHFTGAVVRDVKGQLQRNKSNRQNYKRRVVYLETSNLRYLVYHYNVCARRKKIEVYVIEQAEYQLLRDVPE